MERDREFALGGCLPQHKPVGVIKRRGHPLEGEIAAFQSHLGAASHLVRRGFRVGVGNDGQRKHPVRVRALGEIGHPIVVHLVDPDAQLGVIDQIVDHQAAIDDLLFEAVAVEIGNTQLGRGRPRLRTREIIPLEAELLHLIDMVERALRVGQEAGADAVPHAAVDIADEPVLSVIAHLDAGRALLPFRWRLR